MRSWWKWRMGGEMGGRIEVEGMAERIGVEGMGGRMRIGGRVG